MPHALQQLRALIEAHPNRAARLLRPVESLEAAVASEPELCLHRVRTLFEAVHETVAPLFGVSFGRNGGFPDRMRGVIQALDFSIAAHPQAATINQHLGDLLRGIDDTAVALARLSNIGNMRHGGSLDWGTLERQHAAMLGGLCDTLVSFLFEVAWCRGASQPVAPEPLAYDDFAAFNASLDDEYGDVEIAGASFEPSRILFTLDPTQYDSARQEWEAEQAIVASQPSEAA